MESFGETKFEAPVVEACAPEFGGHAVTAMESSMANTEVLIHMSAMENVVSLINHEINANGLTMEGALELHGATLEASVKGVGGKVKASVQKLWGAVKSFFSAIRRTFDGMVMSTKQFAEKYKSQIENAKTSGMKHKCYNYTHLDGAVADVYGGSKIDAIKNGSDAEGGKAALNDYRGSLVGKGSLEADAFSKAVFSYFRDGAEGESGKKEHDVNVHTVLNTVKSNEKYVKDLAAGETKMNTFFQNALKEIAAEETKVNKEGAGKSGDAAKEATSAAAKLNSMHSRISAANTIAQTFINGWRAAVVEQDKTNKQILTRALNYKKKD